jgi:hypothetical protein
VSLDESPYRRPRRTPEVVDVLFALGLDEPVRQLDHPGLDLLVERDRLPDVLVELLGDLLVELPLTLPLFEPGVDGRLVLHDDILSR